MARVRGQKGRPERFAQLRQGLARAAPVPTLETSALGASWANVGALVALVAT